MKKNGGLNPKGEKHFLFVIQLASRSSQSTKQKH